MHGGGGFEYLSSNPRPPPPPPLLVGVARRCVKAARLVISPGSLTRRGCGRKSENVKKRGRDWGERGDRRGREGEREISREREGRERGEGVGKHRSEFDEMRIPPSPPSPPYYLCWWRRLTIKYAGTVCSKVTTIYGGGGGAEG